MRTQVMYVVFIPFQFFCGALSGFEDTGNFLFVSMTLPLLRLCLFISLGSPQGLTSFNKKPDHPYSLHLEIFLGI